MPINIEIEIEDEVYERLKIESAKNNMDVKKYIPVVIEKYNHDTRENYSYIEEKVKKPLKKILTDLEGLNGNMGENSLYNRVLLLPLRIYTKPLPKGFSKLIEYYKSKGWYNIEHFYLITDGKGVLGYLGLNIIEEDAPYGRYLLIYGFNLYKEFQNNLNLNYIINYIKSIGRQGKCYSIDILFENCNLTYEQLKQLGFEIFTSIDIIKLNTDKDYDKIDETCLDSKQCDIEAIGDYIPIARPEPFVHLYNQWIDQKHKIEVRNNIYKTEYEKVEFIYIKEPKMLNKTLYHYYTILVKPEFAYNDQYIKKVISVLNRIASKKVDHEDNRDSAASIPKEFSKNSSVYTEKDILDSINWLRKNNS